MEKKKEILVIVGSLLIIILSVTLAYFTVQIIGKGKEISLDSANLKITFASGGGNISSTNIEPGWSSGASTFTVKNESKDTYKYNIIIKDLINTFVTKGFLLYKITSTDGGYNMGDFVDVPKSTSATDTILAYSVEIAKGVTHTYTVEFKYLTSEEDQSDDMGRILSGTLYIEKGTDKPLTLAEKLLEDNPTIQTRGSFSTVFTTTNTGTLYKTTEKNVHNTSDTAVYYFAGDAKNNWVKFGTYKINGPIRGYYSSISTSYREYVSMEECTSASSYNYNCSYTWSAGDDIYWRIIRTNHDGSIRLLYSGTATDTTSGYIGTSKFNILYKDAMYVGYMYGTSGTLASNRTNENNSKIKTYIDNWYSNYLSNYTKYISTEAVYCNDREVGSGKYSATGSVFCYAPQTRLYTNNAPSYNCANSKDAFSGSNSEAKLIYPIGLMTADEITYAGGLIQKNLASPYAWYYLNSAGSSITGSTYWWLLSPYIWDGNGARSWRVHGSYEPGQLSSFDEDTYLGVRPAISIKSDVLWSSGDGSPENPYEIVYN